MADNAIPSHHLSNLRLNRDLEGLGENSAVYLSINNIFDRNPGYVQNLTSLGRNSTLGLHYGF